MSHCPASPVTWGLVSVRGIFITIKQQMMKLEWGTQSSSVQQSSVFDGKSKSYYIYHTGNFGNAGHDSTVKKLTCDI